MAPRSSSIRSTQPNARSIIAPPFLFWAACAALYALLVALYLPSLHFAPLSLDDSRELAAIAHRPFSSVWARDEFGHFRPVKAALFWLLAHHTDWSVALRSLILFVFLSCGVAVQRTAGTLLRSRNLGLAVCACWALHPALASVVCWLSGAHVVIACLCVLVYLHCAATAASLNTTSRIGPVYLGAAYSSLVLGLLSHELTVVTPLALYLYLRQLDARQVSLATAKTRNVLLGSGLCVLGFLGTYAALPASHVEYRLHETSRWLLSLSAARYLFENVLLWLRPSRYFGVLMADAPRQHLVLSVACWIGLLGLGAALFWLRARIDKLVAFGLAWSVLFFAPFIDLIPLGNTPVAVHYLCLPSLGFALALVRGVVVLLERASISRRRLLRVALAGCSLVVGALSIPETAQEAAAFGDSRRLFELTVQNHPDNVEALTSLAAIDLADRDFAHAQALLEHATRLAPQDLNVIRNSYALLWQTEQLPAALALLDRHPELADLPEFLIRRGEIYDRMERHRDARDAFARALDHAKSDSQSAERYAAGYKLSIELYQTHQEREALALIDQLLREYPNGKELLLARSLFDAPPASP